MRDVEHPDWAANLIAAGQLQSGEHVLVVVDEPLAACGSELVAAVRDAGGHPQLELWAGDRPLAAPPPAISEAANEVFTAPLEDGADGVLVADLTVAYTVEGLVDEPVTVRFQGGRVQSIEGGRAAMMLNALVEEAGESARVIAELGLGLNPTISPRGHVMLDEKAARTAHVAIGSNTGPYGGRNQSSIHVDCIFSEPTIEVDGEPVELPIHE